MGFQEQILMSRKASGYKVRHNYRTLADPMTVRTTRARIIMLRNDYKDLMNAIEKHLHEHFATLQDHNDTPSATTTGPGMLGDSIPETLDEPFAKVNSVVPGSPADSAGLKAGDEIRNFGYVNRANHDNLKKVAECVQGNQGQNVLVKVSRSADATRRQELQLTLVPRLNWGGRGMLGCHILPI
jgi:26S proteasome non-ATPase regulatory subunit 9